MSQAAAVPRPSVVRPYGEVCDTHLFLNGETDDDTFEMLQRVAANTCYLHQTMIQMPPLKIGIRLNGQPISL